MKKIKILALSYLFPNPENKGYGIFVFNRLQAVNKYCDVKVIAPQQWFPFLNRLRRTPVSKNIKSYASFKGMDVFYPRFLSIPKYLKWLDSIFYFLSVLPVVFYLKYRGKYDFDIVDVHWTYPDILAGYLFSRIYRKKFIVTIRGKEALYPGERGGRKWILNTFLRKTDAVICLSEELRQLVITLGVESGRTEVIHNGIDPSVFSYCDQKKAREELSLPLDSTILVSVGSLIRRKGHHDLIKAMSHIGSNKDIALYIVGGGNPEGDYSLELNRLVEDYQLTNVHFVSSVDHDQLPFWYAAADLFCLATAGEGCPNVVLEAMACGCPVVVSNVGAVPDIVRENVDGLIVQINKWDWADQIVKALSLTWNRLEIAQHMGKVDWASCADRVFVQYQKVLSDETPKNRLMTKNAKHRILYHHRTLGDGAEGIHIREMVAAFRELGHEVKVIGPVGEAVPEKGTAGKRLSAIKSKMPKVVFELCEIGYSFYSFCLISWLIFKDKPNFIYDRYITFNIGGVLAAKLLKVPLFLEVNAPLALERSEQPDEKLYLKKVAFALERWACSNTFRTIVVSAPLRDYFVRQSVTKEKIIVMPNGVNPDKFCPHEKDHVLMGELGICPDRIVIGFTGVLRHWHGLDVLIDAFGQLVKQSQNVFLLIVGDGPIRNSLESQIKSYGIEDLVSITGRVPYDEIQKYVNLFDIAVSPKSTFYASPMKVLEYMALGKAVVVPDRQNFLDIFGDSLSALTFQEGDVCSLYEKILFFISDSSARETYSHNARKLIVCERNWVKIADHIARDSCYE